jgi:hypothetical protein
MIEEYSVMLTKISRKGVSKSRAGVMKRPFCGNQTRLVSRPSKCDER